TIGLAAGSWVGAVLAWIAFRQAIRSDQVAATRQDLVEAGGGEIVQ
ncbi:MAG: hypothetical protein QOD63_2583, partial [Actinomycetota bacterium]|nr:hypothetical protein [Actinomycetota bacterium]